MSTNRWIDIWNSRGRSQNEASVLQHLIYLDGFDGGGGHIAESGWIEYVSFMAEAIGIEDGDSLFEVGCGSGAFLYPFARKGAKVGGLDSSGPLIRHAQTVFPGADFGLGEAASVDSGTKYDIVLSNSVFHYFPDLDYAERVVARMLDKAIKKVAVLDVPDEAVKVESEAARRGALPPGEYDRKYDGLLHLYFSRSWFVDLAARHGCRARVFDKNIHDHVNSRFRFHCVVEKAT